MKDWRQSCISAQTSMRDAMQVVDQAALQIALVTNEQKQLIGTVTDGDIRRAILANHDLTTPVSQFMNKHPATARETDSDEAILEILRSRTIGHLPVVSKEGHIVGLKVLSDLIANRRRDNWAVLMAGGLGKRLHPLTSDTPKPLLKVGESPILETILESLRDKGFSRFFISVNYRPLKSALPQ